MKTNTYRSILAASLASALLSGSAWAVTLPVAQDNSSTPTGAFSAATGKATSLSIAPNRTAYVRFDLTKLPGSVTAGSLRNARLILYATKLAAAGDLAISDVTTAWSETSVGGAATVGGFIATIPAAQLGTKRFLVVDVTAEVNGWLLGAANNGIAISSSTAKVTLGSKEGASTGYSAELEIDIDSTVAASGNTVLAGDVGIGTSNPSQLFDVAGNRGDFLVHPYFNPANSTVLLGSFSSVDNNGAQLRFGRTDDFIDIGQNGSGGFVIENGFDAAMLTVTQNGIVGIGTSTPFARLHVVNPTSGNGQEYAFDVAKNDSNFTNSILLVRTFGSGLPYNLELFEGNAFKPGGGAWAVVSDRRLKKNIEPLAGALDHLLKLRSVTYEYKEPQKVHQFPGTQIGFVAQEVEEVFPEWVTENADGHKAVTIRGFESLSVQALRELRAEKDEQIKTLSSENAALKKRLDEMEARVSARLGRLTALEKVIGTLAAEKSGADSEVLRVATTVNP